MEIIKGTEDIERKTAVCTISGGLDSVVAAALMYESGFDLHFIFFDWGQKTSDRELECAELLSEHYEAKLEVVEVPLLKSLPGISLTQEETQTTAINEYVPNRNAILETQVVAFAESIKAGAVCVGSTGGDNICPDNSQEFIDAMQQLINEGTMLKPNIKMLAPLLATNKKGVVGLGKELNVPFGKTWSCHNNNDQACGTCSNCESRLKAFESNGMNDPIKYKK